MNRPQNGHGGPYVQACFFFSARQLRSERNQRSNRPPIPTARARQILSRIPTICFALPKGDDHLEPNFFTFLCNWINVLGGADLAFGLTVGTPSNSRVLGAVARFPSKGPTAGRQQYSIGIARSADPRRSDHAMWLQAHRRYRLAGRGRGVGRKENEAPEA